MNRLFLFCGGMAFYLLEKSDADQQHWLFNATIPLLLSSLPPSIELLQDLKLRRQLRKWLTYR